MLPYLEKEFETYVFGDAIEGQKITKSQLKSFLFSNTKVTVHCHRNNEILKMLWYRFLGAKFKLVATRHAESKPSKLTLFLLKKADVVITLIKTMSASLGIENTLIPHGVRVNEFVPNVNTKLENIAQKNVILNAGRVRKAKGQLVMLEASSILQQHKNWALVIVGKVDKPEFLRELKAIAKSKNIENQVYFIDETRAILSYYQAAKILVAPSFSEGFSLVTAEAMSSGCTVVATKNVGVHSEMITDAKNGYLYEAGNSSELKEILTSLIEEKKPYLGKSAREEIIKNWSAEKEAILLSNIYKSN